MIFCRIMMLINFVGCSNLKSVKSLTLAKEVLGKFLRYAVEPTDSKNKHKLRVCVTKTIRLIRKHEEVKVKLHRLTTARLLLDLMVRMKDADDAKEIAKTKEMHKEDKADVENSENSEIQEKYEEFKKEYERLENQKEHYEQAIDRLKSDIVEMCALLFDRCLTQNDLQKFFEEDLKSVMKNAGKYSKSSSLYKKCLVSKCLDE